MTRTERYSRIEEDPNAVRVRVVRDVDFTVGMMAGTTRQVIEMGADEVRDAETDA